MLARCLRRSWWMSLRCHVNAPKKRAGPIRVPLCPRRQRLWYSGKKKRHTLKLQLMVHPVTCQILCVTTGHGATHDLRLPQESKTAIRPDTELLADAGYQRIQHQHTFTRTARKASKHHPLTDIQRADNCRLARARLPVDHDQAAAQSLPHPQGDVAPPTAPVSPSSQPHCRPLQPHSPSNLTFAGGLMVFLSRH